MTIRFTSALFSEVYPVCNQLTHETAYKNWVQGISKCNPAAHVKMITCSIELGLSQESKSSVSSGKYRDLIHPSYRLQKKHAITVIEQETRDRRDLSNANPLLHWE